MNKKEKRKKNKYISYRDPGVFNHLVNGRALVWVGFQTKLDQIFALGGNICPLGLGELVLARPRKEKNIRVFFQKFKFFFANLILFFIPGDIG